MGFDKTTLVGIRVSSLVDMGLEKSVNVSGGAVHDHYLNDVIVLCSGFTIFDGDKTTLFVHCFTKEWH